MRRELPFLLVEPGSHGAPVRLRGQIDLLVLERRTRTVTVVDYKHARAGDGDDYRFQLDAYALAAHRLVPDATRGPGRPGVPSRGGSVAAPGGPPHRRHRALRPPRRGHGRRAGPRPGGRSLRGPGGGLLSCRGLRLPFAMPPSVGMAIARPVIALLLVLLLAGVAEAKPSTPTQPDPQALQAKRRAARIERGAGLALAGIGIGTCAAGVALLGISGRAPYEQGSFFEVAGYFLAAGGVALAVPGAILAIDGQRRLTEIDWRLRLIAGAYLVPAPGGVLAGLGFRF